MVKISGVQKEVLNRLVDSFEKRQDYGTAEKSSRRTMLKINSRSFPDYFHVSDSSFRLMFNEEMEDLERRGLVGLEWERFNRGHVLQKIILKEEALPEIYRVLGRRSKKQIYRETKELLAEMKAEAPRETGKFYDCLMEKIADYKPLPSPLRIDKRDDLVDLLKGFNALFAERGEETAKRVLSVHIYGDSKRWQHLEKGILQLYRHHFSGGTETDLEDSDLLTERGIVDNPSHILLSGFLVVDTPRGQIDLSLFEPDLGLPAGMAKDLDIVSCAAEKVVIIENLTAFYGYIREQAGKDLVVYSGGFTGKGPRFLLQKLYRFFQEQKLQVPFYFWGDIDLGGFRIWHNLRKKTGIPFEQYLMDEATYLQYLSLGQPVTDKKYILKLASLLEQNDFAPFHPLIRLLMDNKIRLEQEAIIMSQGQHNA